MLLWHYTDPETAKIIAQDQALRAFPVIVQTQLFGGRSISLAKAVWFTTADSCPTVMAKLILAGHQELHRFGVDLDLPTLDQWASVRGYRPVLFQWMLLTAQLAGEDWRNWRLASEDVPL